MFQHAPDFVPYSEETESLKEVVDLLIVVSNDNLPGLDSRPFFSDMHDYAHHQMWLAAKTIVDVMTFNGVVSVDFEDVRSFTKNGGYVFFTFGQASGEVRVEKAVRMAMPATSLITPQAGLTGNLLLYIYYGYYGPKEITMQEIGEIVDIFQKAVNLQGDILWNCGYDPTLKDDLRITVIRTGVPFKPPD